MATLYYVVLWAPFSFLLHNIIHEGAHALVVLAYSGNVTKFWPFPSKQLGYFSWAHVEYERPSEKGNALVAIAPILLELLWLGVAFAFVLSTTGWIRMLLLVEVISSCVDMVTWLLGAWSTNPQKDARQLELSMGWKPGASKLLVAALLPVLTASLFLTILTVEKHFGISP